MTDLPSIQTSGRTTYDETPYPSGTFPQTHPNRLAAMARLFGVEAPLPSTARVLELGCAHGLNLLPMAEMAPQARFLGIDASQVQIADGRKAIEAAGLKNVELRVQNILDFPASEGKFDYIIAHGVFSWVPQTVREKILSICREHLTDNGVAYISYNALPGWNMGKSLRDVMLYHTAPFKEPETKVQQARAILDFLAQSVPADGNAYGLLLKNELSVLRRRKDGFLRHDLLEEENTAFYFHEFVAQADRHGLQFLSEPSLSEMLADNFPEKIRTKLKEIGQTILAREQYSDFLKNRSFRQTLLCRREVTLLRNIDATRMRGLCIQSLLKPVPATAATPAGAAVFAGSNGVSVTTTNRFLGTALQLLAQQGAQALAYPDLFRAVCNTLQTSNEVRTEAQDATDNEALSTLLANLLTKGMVAIFAEPVVFSPGAPAKPAVSFLARYWAMRGHPIVSRLHQSADVDGFVSNLVDLCDGSRTGDQLLDELVARVQAGGMSVTDAGQPVTDSGRLKALLAPRMLNTAATLAAAGFFAPEGKS